MSYRTYIRLRREDPRLINNWITTSAIITDPDYIEISEKDRMLLQSYRPLAMWSAAAHAIVMKPIVKIEVEPQAGFLANGDDYVTATFDGVPEDQAEIRVLSGGALLVLARGEPLEITTRVPGFITIQLAEPHLYARPVTVQAHTPEEDPNGES